MGISAATTHSTLCSWSMRVLRRRKTREHHVTKACPSGKALTSHPQGQESLSLGKADSLFPDLSLVGILIAQRRRRSWKSWSWTPVYSHPIAYCPKTADFTPHLPESQCFLFLRVNGRYALWTCLSTCTCIELKSLRSVYLLAASLTWASC